MTPRQVGLLAALSAIWGGSYLLIKYALEDFSAPVIVWARTAIAAIVLAVAMRGAVLGALADMRRRPRWAALLGFVAVAAPFTLITFGEHEVPSGLTAVLISPAARRSSATSRRAWRCSTAPSSSTRRSPLPRSPASC
jgi:drug/metabolite transporter (DMT)-like permease